MALWVGRPAPIQLTTIPKLNKTSGVTLDEATLKVYRETEEKLPGTKMIFPGLPSDDDVANVIAYLKQFGSYSQKL